MAADKTVVLDAKWLRQEAVTAFWVFLSPLAGFWWAFDKCYPLFKDRAGQ